DPQALVVLRHFVGAGESAVLAADTLIVEMLDDARFGVFLVGAYRTAVHASWIQAMVTSGGDRLLDRGLGRAAMDQTNGAPGFVVVESVQLVAADDTRLAASAGIEIHL